LRRLTALGYTHVKGKKADLIEKLKAGKPKPGEEAIAPATTKSPSGGSGKKRGRKSEQQEEEEAKDEDKPEKEQDEQPEKSAKTDSSPAPHVSPPEERVAALDNAAGAKDHAEQAEAAQ
jgi:hypothetical protein